MTETVQTPWGPVELFEDTRASMQNQLKAGIRQGLTRTATDMAKGAVTGPFTAAPDIAGLMMRGNVRAPNFLRQQQFSGDPIREAVGLDPRSAAGIAGEMIDPTNALAKGAKVAGKLSQYAPDIQNYLAMTLFHGTPHKFSKFDLDKIGTGEGAQAFGHGLYCAESPGVARSYQTSLTSTIPGAPTGGSRYQISGAEFPSGRSGHQALDTANDIEMYLSARKNGYSDLAEVNRRNIENRIQYWEETATGQGIADQDMSELVDFWRDHARSAKPENITENFGHLYEVEIPDKVTDRMLDWDKPLSEQPENVRQAIAAIENYEIRSFAKSNPTGGEFYIKLSGGSAERGQDAIDEFIRLGFPPEQAKEMAELGSRGSSEFLSQSGIPGIRYKSGQLSGGKGDTHNIVVFDPEDIVQVKRDGELVYERGK